MSLRFWSFRSCDVQENQKQAPPVPKKPGKSKPALGREKSNDTVDKQRQEARKRLMAAKRAQSVKQNSATESADSIEIYVPEAQTRLWGDHQTHSTQAQGLRRHTQHQKLLLSFVLVTFITQRWERGTETTQCKQTAKENLNQSY